MLRFLFNLKAYPVESGMARLQALFWSLVFGLIVLSLTACGSPRGDGIPWEKTYPKGGESVAEIDKLYGNLRSVEHLPNGDESRTYSNWRVKNEFNGMMHRSDYHTVTFHDGKAVAWK